MNPRLEKLRKPKQTRRSLTQFVQFGLAGIVSSIGISSTLHAQTHSPASSPSTNRLEVVKKWDFGVEEDVKGDRWPDDWIRKTGMNYPKYLQIGITRNANSKEELEEIQQFRRSASQWVLAWQLRQWPWEITPESAPKYLDQWLDASVLNPYLQIEMEGGAAEVDSILIPIDKDSVYGITCQALADCPTKEYEASASIQFLNAKKETIYEASTDSLTGVASWRSLIVDTQYPYLPDAAFVQIRLKVSPRQQNALRGRFAFDSVRLMRSPRISLNVDRPNKIYFSGDSVLVTSRASGMNSSQSTIDIRLSDHTGSVVAKRTESLVPEQADSANFSKFAKTTSVQPSVRSVGKAELQTTGKWSGAGEWVLNDLQPGYYELRTQLERSATNKFELVERFVVLARPDSENPNADIGLAIPEDRMGITFGSDPDKLIELLRTLHIGRIKIPVWFDPKDLESARQLSSRIDRLQSAGIQCVGVISTPPATILKDFPRFEEGDSASALEDAVNVQSYLEPVFQFLCSRLVHFQLGWDDETDFVATPALASTMKNIENLVRRYGQDVRIIGSHNPIYQWNDTREIQIWQLFCDMELTARETKTYMTAESKVLGARQSTWLSLAPLSNELYSLKSRVQDLTERSVLLADPKWKGSVVSWIFDPMAPQRDLITPQGFPMPMFAPLRTLAELLNNAQSYGCIPSSELGSNVVLEKDGNAKLLIWGSQKLQAEMYLGKNISARDIWGRRLPIDELQSSMGPIQSLAIGDWPVIVDGIDIHAARWRMGTKIVSKQLDVVIGRDEVVNVEFTNPFPFSVSGKMRPVCSAFAESAEMATFTVEPEAKSTVAIPVKLSTYASSGIAPIQIIADIDGPDGPIKIAIDGELLIGSDEFDFELDYSVNERNELVVEVDATNKSGKPANFDCYLAVPGRMRQRTQFAKLVDRSRRTFVFPNADQLSGETLWLQCEQIGDNRIINKRLQITK